MPYKGLPGGQYRVLSDQDVERIHGTALQVLERVGVWIADEAMRDLLGEHGAQVDHDNGIVKFPAKVVEWALEVVPAEITLYGREEQHTLELEDKRVYLGTGGAAVQVLDKDTDRVRKSTLEDLGNLARLVDALDNIHFFLRPVVAQDIPQEKLDVNKYYASLANTTKHVMANAYTVKGAREVIELASMVAGDREQLIERPFI
ncbi:MAG: trimethylamine methyltransferase family protein, partial [Candidatus Bipolaricaulia bacterium]